MAAEPNLNRMARFCYALAGAALIAWGFFGAESEWGQYLSAIGGGVLVVEGAIGH